MQPVGGMTRHCGEVKCETTPAIAPAGGGEMKNWVIVGLLVLVGGGLAAYAVIHDDGSKELAAMKTALAQMENDNKIWRAEAETRQAQNEARNAELEAKNQILSGQLAARQQQINQLQSALAERLKATASLPPASLAARWEDLVSMPAGSVLIRPEGYTVSDSAGRQTVASLEKGAAAIQEVGLLRQDKADLTAQVENLTEQRDNANKNYADEKEKLTRSEAESVKRQEVASVELAQEKKKTRRWKLIAIGVTLGAAYLILGR